MNSNNLGDRGLNHFSLSADILLKSSIISFPPEQNKTKPGYGNVQIFFFFFLLFQAITLKY